MEDSRERKKDRAERMGCIPTLPAEPHKERGMCVVSFSIPWQQALELGKPADR